MAEVLALSQRLRLAQLDAGESVDSVDWCDGARELYAVGQGTDPCEALADTAASVLAEVHGWQAGGRKRGVGGAADCGVAGISGFPGSRETLPVLHGSEYLEVGGRPSSGSCRDTSTASTASTRVHLRRSLAFLPKPATARWRGPMTRLGTHK